MTADLRSLIERALHDLRQGWPEAAYDALGQALRLLEEAPRSSNNPTTTNGTPA